MIACCTTLSRTGEAEMILSFGGLLSKSGYMDRAYRRHFLNPRQLKQGFDQDSDRISGLMILTIYREKLYAMRSINFPSHK